MVDVFTPANCLHRLREYSVDLKIVQIGAGQDVNPIAARGATARLRGGREKDDHRMTTRRRDMRGAGVVADGEHGGAGEIDQAGKLGATNEIDCRPACCADFGRERLLAMSADNDREDAGRLE